MAELCRRPLVYRATVLSLSSLYREELPIVAAIKRRFPHIEVWLTHTDGRAGALAEASRLGADGLFDDEGFHRFAVSVHTSMDRSSLDDAPARNSASTNGDETDKTSDGATNDHSASASFEDDISHGEPVLTADELRALLQDPPRGEAAGS